MRKIFNYDNFAESKIIDFNDKKQMYENTVSACGTLFYKIKNKKLWLLLIKYASSNWPRLDDFGGQIDNHDATVLDAIYREVYEETNGCIDKSLMARTMTYGFDSTFYNKYSKYYLILIKSESDFFDDTSVFGDCETTDNIERVVSWYEYDVVRDKLARRLDNVIEHLDSINKSIGV